MWADVYRLRPEGFSGSGLNDASWGAAFSGAATSYYEVVIDGTGAPDTFKWRKNGGGWTTLVSITGGAQTLDDNQQITFAATTGHTVDDQWVIGNFKDELTTESGVEAQITDSTKRILNPYNSPTFTDDGGQVVIRIDHVRGLATFDGNVGNVDVDGNNAFVLLSGLQRVGYLLGWDFTWDLEMADASRCQRKWKEAIPGMGSGEGSCDTFFIAADSWFDSMLDEINGVQSYHFLQLFNYEPNADQAGDHFNVWVSITKLDIDTAMAELIHEQLGFTLLQAPAFTAQV